MIFQRHLRVDAEKAAVQRLVPPNDRERFEGVSFSPSGEVLGIATSEGNSVVLFRKRPDGRFEDAPYASIGGLRYPHDLCFGICENTELLAVAQRGNAVSIFQRNPANDSYGPEPIFVIDGPASRLNNTDGVAFLPPDNAYLAACNLISGNVCFYRRLLTSSPIRFEISPEFELKHPSIKEPDGLAFSSCGTWLALANHGGQSVSVFRRRPGTGTGELMFGPEPVAVITDPQFRYPHSVAFTADDRHLVVTNAGANYFAVFRMGNGRSGVRGSSPVLRQAVNDEAAFLEVNTQNRMEGGPKGIAVHGNSLAVCSPEFGVKIYPIQ